MQTLTSLRHRPRIQVKAYGETPALLVFVLQVPFFERRECIFLGGIARDTYVSSREEGTPS